MFAQEGFKRGDEYCSRRTRGDQVAPSHLGRARIVKGPAPNSHPRLQRRGFQSSEFAVDVYIARVRWNHLEGFWVNACEGKNEMGKSSSVDLRWCDPVALPFTNV